MTIHLFFHANREQENSMEKWWLNSMLVTQEFEPRCRLSKSMGSRYPIDNTSRNENPSLNYREKKIHSWSNSNVDLLFGIRDIRNFISDDTFLVRDSKGDTYSIYFDSENQIFDIQYDTKYSLNKHIASCIDIYLHSLIRLHSQMHIETSFLSDNDNYTNSYIFDESKNSPSTNAGNNNLDLTKDYSHLWIQCENCYELNYKKFLKSKLHICKECGYHLQMSSSDRIELLIDRGTWDPLDEDMVSLDPIEFHSSEEPYTDLLEEPYTDSSEEPYTDLLEEPYTDSSEEPYTDLLEEPYTDRINSYQEETGLTEAVQTGIGQLNGIPLAIGVMDFQFIGGSMGSVVGEKITRLIEYATNQKLPLIIVCASGGARMQEGSLSLMQMAKISSVLYDYQSNNKLFYVSILTSPTTGGVTASFGMLGDIIISEPNAYIAFAGKRVIEETLNTTVPEGSQEAEYLFDKGLFDLIVPRNLLKEVLSELFQLHAFFPSNLN
uniref:acetyl-CoA carboxylase carboxyltransferase beta subunit n=1 Tax=Limonium franchetii TaxID=3073090 RepID=UPI002E79683E|nr:acetyl-CoA carboxylase carboxyltransferase beta subunit [Limonium franchetii]WMS59847.1 acetyl-CoA carboxylase carboxyltransferase beta subunit [Limonium franchetii]